MTEVTKGTFPLSDQTSGDVYSKTQPPFSLGTMMRIVPEVTVTLLYRTNDDSGPLSGLRDGLEETTM